MELNYITLGTQNNNNNNNSQARARVVYVVLCKMMSSKKKFNSISVAATYCFCKILKRKKKCLEMKTMKNTTDRIAKMTSF